MTPEEEHLLESVDGTLGGEELAFVTGMTPDDVGEALERLALLGVVTFEAPKVVEKKKKEVPADGIELSPEMRAAVETLHQRLETDDYYALLGVTRHATKDEIKKAYYKLGPKYHTDRYYGKNLGPFKAKIDMIFTTLTRAHDTLRYKKRREQYDIALPAMKPGDRIKRIATPAPAPDRISEPGDSSPPPRSSQPASVHAGGARPSSHPGARQSSPPPRDERGSDPGRGSMLPSDPPPARATRPGAAPEAKRSPFRRQHGTQPRRSHSSVPPPPREKPATPAYKRVRRQRATQPNRAEPPPRAGPRAPPWRDVCSARKIRPRRRRRRSAADISSARCAPTRRSPASTKKWTTWEKAPPRSCARAWRRRAARPENVVSTAIWTKAAPR